MSWPWQIESKDCTETHRGPQGPNEDLSQCWQCGTPTYRLRPVGETFGEHQADCSLPVLARVVLHRWRQRAPGVEEGPRVTAASSSKTCDYQWPADVEMLTDHRCAEPAGHSDWHICRDGARLDAEVAR